MENGKNIGNGLNDAFTKVVTGGLAAEQTYSKPVMMSVWKNKKI